MNNEIRWFCHLATNSQVLTPDDCVAVVEAFEADSIDPELGDFVQVFLDNNLCKQAERLEELMTEATEVAATGPAPRLKWMPGAAAAVPEGTEGWLCGWPQLEKAATAAAEEARDLFCDFLQRARELGCSDVHLSAGARPFVRRFKSVHLLPDQEILSPEAAQALNLAVLEEQQLATFQQTRDVDFSFKVGASDRYRANLMLQRLGVAGSYRIIDARIPSLRELGFQRPEILEKLTTYHQGLILVTGPAGAGKSTTLTAFIDHINTNRHDHIITVEDPIEVVHQPKNCNVTQREVKRHTHSFATALRAALREDPDVIIIGELRDLETIEMAIRASETGHLVIGTLHTGSAATTMDRVLDVFPPNQQAQVRAMAAESLKGVICQQMLPNKANDGLVLAAEIMLGTLAVSNVVREGETFKLPSIIQTSYNIGMCTMEQSFYDLYMADQRSYEQTAPLIKNADLLRNMQVNEAKMAAEAAGLNKKKRGWFG